MIDYLSTQINDYSEFKRELDTALNNTANNIVQAGYLLIKARDTDILKESGYAGMGEFAQKEYGLSPDQTSRFIGIAERFGDGVGRLQDKYQGYGYTKLSEMLTLTDVVIEALPEEITRDEIRELKAEIKAEEQITPIEAAIEKAETDDGEELPLIVRFFKEYFRPVEHAQEFFKAIDIDWATIWGPGENKKAVLDALAPSGIGILEARIPGAGRYMLSFKGEEAKPTLVSIRENTSTDLEWDVVRGGFSDLADKADNDLPREQAIRKMWEELYGEPFPPEPEDSVKKEPENAQKSQKVSEKPAKASSKPEKASKTVKIAPAQPKSKPDKSDAPITVTGPAPKQDESIEGKMNPPEEEKPEAEVKLTRAQRGQQIDHLIVMIRKAAPELEEACEAITEINAENTAVYTKNLVDDMDTAWKVVRDYLMELIPLKHDDENDTEGWR